MTRNISTTPARKRAPGGGRKRTIGTVRVAVTLGREHLAYLRTVDGNRSAAIRRVIEEHRALHWLLAMVDKPGWIDPPLPVGVELDPAYAEIAKRRVEEAIAKGAHDG